MSAPLLPSAPDAAFDALIERAHRHDGQPPFNDQALVDARNGARALLTSSISGEVVVAAILGAGELELVVDPEARGAGLGRAALEQVLADAPAELLAWAHGDHPAARALAASHGFEPVRTLLHLELDPLPEAGASTDAGASTRGDVTITAAHDLDPAEWVALNARVFATHPEQGRMTVADLEARRAEPWFDAGDFLVARGGDGGLIGYNWLKLEPGSDRGEIYVIGIDSEHAGRGLGRRLMTAGLARIRERGRTSADLYVEGENRGAVGLYRSLGFTDQTVDVQYARRASVA